jgi:hypothetical protein
MPKLLRAFVLVSAVLAATVVPALALVTFDFEQSYFIEPGVEIKDHALIRVDGVYHLFYLRGNPAVNIGHATSPDLIHWTTLPPVLSIDPSAWDNHAMWAPAIVKHDNAYMMYYTGVNTAGSQATGLAVTGEFEHWYKLPWSVYHPDPSWATWSDTEWSHGRDPFIFQYNGKWYMLNTALTRGALGAISCAESNDLITWTDIGPLFTNTSWHVMESVQCIPHGNKWNLFFTEETVAGISTMASDSLFSGWDISKRVVIDFGAAAEINQFDPDKYIISRHAIHQFNNGQGSQFVIKLDSLRWGPTSPYVYRPWPLFKDWQQVSGYAFAYAPTFLNNPKARGVDVDVNFVGNSWLSSSERYQGPLGAGASGDYWGDYVTGVLRSRTFTITGNSINLLVGGGNYPDACYVALVNAGTQAILQEATGENTDAMTRRYWDVRPYKGKQVYIEVVDNSTEAFGHISCDDIHESADVVGTVSSNDKLLRKPPKTSGQTASVVRLFQNTPNPFNPTTSISYSLATDAFVSLEVFDVSGSRVRRLVDGRSTVGLHDVTWDGRDDHANPLSSGIYFYRLVVDGRSVDTKKMILLK